MNKSVNILAFIVLLIVIPIATISVIIVSVLNKSIFNDPIRYYIDITLFISIWTIFAKEIFLHQAIKKEHTCSDFKIVDCMTIILAISTLCYSIIQICNPPIGFAQMLKLIIWNTLIIGYTIWAKPAKTSVFILCLITTCVSVLYILPLTYQNYYEKEIYKIVGSTDNVKSERCYRLENNDEHEIGYEPSDYQNSNESFQKLLEDQYFTTNFKDTLQKSIFTYQKFKNTNTTVIKPTIAVKDINGNLKDRIVLGEDLVLKISASSANDEAITKFNIDRILLNGISYDYKIIDSGDNWIEISFDSLKGVSGIKTITFLDGYAVDQSGNLSGQFSVAFRYYGYDLIFLIIIAIFSVVFPIYCYKKYR